MRFQLQTAAVYFHSSFLAMIITFKGVVFYCKVGRFFMIFVIAITFLNCKLKAIPKKTEL